MHTNQILLYADSGMLADVTDLYDDDTYSHYSDISIQKIYDATGKYGYMAYCDEQLGYWNFVYQNGGYILNEDKTAAGFDNQATIDATRWIPCLRNTPPAAWATSVCPAWRLPAEREAAPWICAMWVTPSGKESMPWRGCPPSTMRV